MGSISSDPGFEKEGKIKGKPRSKLIGLTLEIAKKAVLMKFFNKISYSFARLTDKNISYYKEMKSKFPVINQ